MSRIVVSDGAVSIEAGSIHRTIEYEPCPEQKNVQREDLTTASGAARGRRSAEDRVCVSGSAGSL